MKISSKSNEGYLNNYVFSIFLFNKSSALLNLDQFPPLSAAPHPPGGIQNGPKRPLILVG